MVHTIWLFYLFVIYFLPLLGKLFLEIIIYGFMMIYYVHYYFFSFVGFCRWQYPTFYQNSQAPAKGRLLSLWVLPPSHNDDGDDDHDGECDNDDDDDSDGDNDDKDDDQSLCRRRRSPSRQWLWQAAAVFASQVIR